MKRKKGLNDKKKEELIKDSNALFVFDTTNLQLERDNVNVDNESDKKVLPTTSTNASSSYSLSNKQIAEKYGVNYEKLQAYIKSKLSAHDIELYKQRYNQRIKKS